MKAARNHSISLVVYVNAFGRNEAALTKCTRLFERINKVHRSAHKNKQQSNLRGVIELLQNNQTKEVGFIAGANIARQFNRLPFVTRQY